MDRRKKSRRPLRRLEVTHNHPNASQIPAKFDAILPQASQEFSSLLVAWHTHHSVVSRFTEGTMPHEVHPYEICEETEIRRFMEEYPHFVSQGMTLIGYSSTGDLLCCDNDTGAIALVSLGDTLGATRVVRHHMVVVAQSLDSAIMRQAAGEHLPGCYWDAKLQHERGEHH